MKNKSLYFFIILLTACTFGKKNNLQNRAFIDSKKIKKVQVIFKIYNNSRTTSILYCKIRTANLLSLFSSKEKQNKINYTLEGKVYLVGVDSPVDSFSISKEIAIDTMNKITEKINLQCKEKEKYIIEISLIDHHKVSTTKHSINIDRAVINKNDYLILNKKNKLKFSSYFNTSDTLFIQNNTNQKTLFVKYYKEKFPLAQPPFLVEKIKSKKIKAENIFLIPTDTTLFLFPINKIGIYQILDKEEAENGMSILSFDNDFPKINTAKNMILPLQYICTNEEFSKLQEAKNPKIAIDEFWLARTKDDKDQAEKLIYTFYKRAEYSNAFFTSYKAGWKTDRGMIMIVFGAPNIIYQSKEGESWIYGEKNNMYALNFTFTKIKNKFSDNDFQLNRSAYFKNIWNIAQESWREGHAYSDMDIKKKIYEQERRERQSQLYFWY